MKEKCNKGDYMKKIFLIINIIILVPILCYITIFFTNNSLAKGIKQNLMEYSLPEKTVLVASMSKAGKLVGNGNGMQYLGIILVESKISKEQLFTH